MYDQLDKGQNATWSLLLASGYLKVLSAGDITAGGFGRAEYELSLTNHEVRVMFGGMVSGWFDGEAEDAYNDFVKALILGDLDAMNEYMNRVSSEIFSSFSINLRICP